MQKRPRKKTSSEEQPTFGKIHDRFQANTDSLETFIKNVSPIATKHDETIMNKFNEEISKIIDKVETNQGGKKKKKSYHKLTNAQYVQFLEILKTFVPAITVPQAELLYRSSFAMMMSYFDFLISDLIHYFYYKFPEALSGKETGMTLSELKSLGSIGDAVNYVINKEVDNILYDSLEKQKEYFNKSLQTETKDKIINWDTLREAMERRHIIVHNDCKINQRYISKVRHLSTFKKNKPPEEGTKINIDQKYFRQILQEICVSGLILIQCCWRKWENENTDKIDGMLIQDIFQALVKEDWICAQRLGLYSKECRIKKHEFRLMLDVNYCQSLKWQGKKKELEEELKKFDISALAPKFVLAICALKSDSKNFYKNIRNAVTVDKLTKENFKVWPLFRELRKNSDYEAKIEAAFNSISEQ